MNLCDHDMHINEDCPYCDINEIWRDKEVLHNQVKELEKENEEWKELHARACTMVIPGEIDSADAYRILYFKMKKGLEFYAQLPIQEDGTVWSDSCSKFGLQSMTWEPLLDLGTKARKILK